MLKPKLVLQEFWQRKIDWVDIIPQDISDRWTKWKQPILYSNHIKNPKWYGYNDKLIFSTHRVSLMEQFLICKLNGKERSNAVLLLESLD